MLYTWSTSAVDGGNVPVRHFGVVLPTDEWERLAAYLPLGCAR